MLHEPIYNAQIVAYLGERIALRWSRRMERRAQQQQRYAVGRIRRVTASVLLRIADRLTQEPTAAASRHR